ncbi:MAG: divalent metal cation transporter [Planctomycetota bacterium]
MNDPLPPGSAAPSPASGPPRAPDDGTPPWSLKPRKLGLRRIFSLGAGAILAAFFIGTGDIVIATQMGAQFGYALWWSYFILALAGWALIDMSVRYYLRFGKTPMSLFKDIHPGFAILLFVIVVVCAIMGSASQWNACAMVLTSFYPEVPLEASGAVAALLAAVLIFQGLFDRLEKLFAAALVALIACFFASALLARADWHQALAGLVPNIPRNMTPAARSAWTNLIVANAGSMINAWLILLYPYTMMEKGWFSNRLQEKANLLHRVRVDYAWAMLAAALVALPIMAASASVARRLGVIPQNYNEFAVLLDPLARQVAGKNVGKFAAKLFLGGLFIAAWTSGVAWWMGGAYALLDIFRLPIRMNSRPMRILVILFLIPSVAILFLRINPAVQIVIFAVFLAVVFPVVGLAVVWRISRRDMGYFRWAKCAALLIAIDIFALAVSILAGWGELSRLLP